MKRQYYFLTLILLSPLCLQAKPTENAPKATSRIDKCLTIYNDVFRQLDMSYADTLNYEDLTEKSIYYLLRTIDPYTVYIPEDKTKDLKYMTTGKYGGIGAIIMQRGDTVYISEPYEGMPAQLNEVRAGDKLLSVDGTRVIGKTTSEVSNLLRGDPKSTVTLSLLREGVKKPITKAFERQQIQISPVPFSCVLGEKTGYVVFTEFTENSAALFSQTCEQLVQEKGIDSLIIDLRGNGGGLIDEAIQIVGLFVPKGTLVVSTKGRNVSSRTYKTPFEPKFPNLNLTVLVDGNSASASEITAGALQDLDRATIVGERTFGKGLVQSVRPIAYNGNLKVTTSKYYIPSGRCIQAIDYSKREQKDGLQHLPDSLRRTFYTQSGRPVKDGGGIDPDIVISDSGKVNISYDLYAQHLFFDYATRYRLQHNSLVEAKAFEVTDSLLQDFKDFVRGKHFTYKTHTQQSFQKVVEYAKEEDIDPATQAAMENLLKQMNDSWEEAFDRNQEEIKEFLGREIVVRYYFQQGTYAYSLRFDKVLNYLKEAPAQKK